MAPAADATASWTLTRPTTPTRLMTFPAPSSSLLLRVPAPVITAALFQRFESRDLGVFTGKILSAMRSEFGGHAEQKG